MAARGHRRLEFGQAPSGPDVEVLGIARLVGLDDFKKVRLDPRIFLLDLFAALVAAANSAGRGRRKNAEEFLASPRDGLLAERGDAGELDLSSMLEAEGEEPRDLSFRFFVAKGEDVPKHGLPALVVEPRRAGGVERNLDFVPGDVHA